MWPGRPCSGFSLDICEVEKVKRLAYFTHYMYNIFLRKFMTYLALNVYTLVCSFQNNREVEKRKNVFHASKKYAKCHQ